MPVENGRAGRTGAGDAILNSLPAQIAVLNSAGRIVTVNAAWCRFGEENGVATRDWTGEDYFAAVHQARGADCERAEQAAAGIGSVLAGQRDQFSMEYPCHTPDKQRWFRLFATPTTLPDGAGAVVMHMDVTEQRLAEIALHDNQCFLQSVVSAAGVGLWNWDLRSDKVYYAPEWKQQLGYEEHEIGDGLDEWKTRVHPDDLEEAMRRTQLSLEPPFPAYSAEFRLRHKDGSYRNMLAQATVTFDENDQPIRMTG